MRARCAPRRAPPQERMNASARGEPLRFGARGCVTPGASAFDSNSARRCRRIGERVGLVRRPRHLARADLALKDSRRRRGHAVPGDAIRSSATTSGRSGPASRRRTAPRRTWSCRPPRARALLSAPLASSTSSRDARASVSWSRTSSSSSMRRMRAGALGVGRSRALGKGAGASVTQWDDARGTWCPCRPRSTPRPSRRAIRRSVAARELRARCRALWS